MSQSRKALAYSIVYSLPLLAWLTAQLEFIEWHMGNLQPLFQQTLAALVLLQSLTAVLLFLNQKEGKWRDELASITHILLFPVPFFVLIWLSGSVTLDVILKSLILPGSVAAMAFIFQRCHELFPSRQSFVHNGISLFNVLLAVLIWNYRGLWWGWSGL